MKRRIMRAFKIDEISAVDRPAQQGATADIMKRDTQADADAKVGKGDTVELLTSSTNGHQHGIRIRHCDHEGLQVYVMYAAGTDENDHGHDHVLVIGPDGTVTMSENHGHTHEVDSEALQMAIMRSTMALKAGADTAPGADQVDQNAGATGNVSTEEVPMTEQEKAEMDALKARAAKAEAILSLSAEERAAYDKFTTDADRDGFLAKSADERKDVLAKAAEATQVVYTDSKGRVYTKADDARLVDLAKEADASIEAANVAKAAAAEADLEKRAKDLEFLPGDLEARKALLKSIDAIADEKQRTAALAALKAKDATLGKAAETIGSADGGDGNVSTDIGGNANLAKSDAEAKLDDLAKKYQADHKVTYAKAYDEVLKTAEGAKLYAAAV